MNKPTMQGWFLYSGSEVKELTRSFEEARAAGVQLDVVHPQDVNLVLDGQEPARVFIKEAEVSLPMFVIAAIVDDAVNAFNLALLQQLETQGVLCVNRAETIKRTSDKLLTLQLLAAQGIPVPKTILIGKHTSASFLREQLGLPMVIKIIDGSKGHGVSLIHSEKELETLLEMLEAAKATASILAQEFIADSRGRDLRVLVIDGKPQVCMLRQNRSPEGFKSNISVGGSATEYPLSDAIRELSKRVISIIGLNIGGIDLLFKGEGFVVGEANSVPGFQGIESCTQLNVPMEVSKSIGAQLKARAAAKMKAMAEKIQSLEDLKGFKEPELVKLFMGACSSPDKIQQTVLLDIVRRNAQTEFGKMHGFETIRSIEDFRRQVPVSDWEVYAPYAKRMEEGETDLLFAGKPTHFVATSGTTGRSKLLPESTQGSLAKSVVSRVRIAMLAQMAPELATGFFIPLSSVASIGKTAGGIPFGFASGFSLAGTSPEMQRHMAFPPDILKASDAETLNYLTMRYSVEQPLVRMLVGNNPGRMTTLFELADRRRDQLIADIEHGTISADLKLEPELRQRLEKGLMPNPERAQALRQMVTARGRLEPRDFWPGLKLISCWLGGTIGRYLDGLKPWLPETVAFVDCGYGASEGKFNVPVKMGVSAAPLGLFSYFFEFKPMKGGDPLLAHELKEDEDYGLLVTNYSGLYRYDMHDIVRVVGFTGKNPNVEFVSKTQDIANLSGEKLTGTYLSSVVQQTLSIRNLRWRHFCVVANSDQHRYDFCMEMEGADFPDEAWMKEMDAQLIQTHCLYSLYRKRNLIQPPRLILMKQGWMNQLYAARIRPGVTTSQIKLPVVTENPPPPEWIEQVVEMTSEAPSPLDTFHSIDDLRGKSELEWIQFFMGSCGAPEKIQQTVLIDMVRRNAQTEYGQKHGFELISSVDDFRRQVPVRDWTAFEPYAKRMEAGEKDLLFSGQPTHFIATSGTTGATKLLPESTDGALAKSIVSRMRTALLMKMAPEIMNGFFIPLANVTAMEKTAGGIPIGYASGLTLSDTSPEVLKHMAFPPAVMKVLDADSLDYLIMRFSVAQPLVRMLAGNNPGRMTTLFEKADQHRDRIIGDIEHGTISADLILDSGLRHVLEKDLVAQPERAQTLRQKIDQRGRLEPRDYWPGLKMIACWLGGTIGRYLEGLKPWLPENVLFADLGYGASEGKFNLPMKPGTVAGPLALFGYFLEFKPMGGGDPLLVHELKDGEDYGLIVTNYSGLYRYDLHDIVRVVGFTGKIPNIEFVSKTQDIANLSGEKVTGVILSTVVQQTLSSRNLRWRHFCVVADSGQHRYDFCVEPEGPNAPDDAWRKEVDQQLIQSHPLYSLYRNQSLLRPPRLLVMKPGWMDQLYAARTWPGVTTSQIKLPLVCTQLPLPEFVAQIIEA